MRASTFQMQTKTSVLDSPNYLYICIPPKGVNDFNVILIQTLLQLVNVVHCRLLQERGCH